MIQSTKQFSQNIKFMRGESLMKKLMILFVLFTISFAFAQMEGADTYLRWSPKGNKVIISDLEAGKFLVYDVQTAEAIAIETLSGGSMAVWSPDGKKNRIQVNFQNRQCTWSGSGNI